MPVITKIEPQKRLADRFNIFVDGVYSFAVYVDILLRFRLKVGMSLTPDLTQQILQDENIVKIYTKALVFISYQSRTEKEIKDKLFKLVSKSVEDEAERIGIISRVIQKLQEARLIDDSSYARSYIQNSLTLKQIPSKQKLTVFLRKKGISQEIIEEELLHYSTENELDGANTIFAKKIRQLGGPNSLKDQKTKSKVWRFLAGKGYSSATIKALFDTLPEVY